MKYRYRETHEMKDSGVEWLGMIPKDWELKPFKHILKERNEKNNPVRSSERLSLSIEKGITLYSEKTTNLDRFKDDVSMYKLAHKGDLVLNSMNMIVGAVGVSKYFGCVSPVYYTYYDGLESDFLTKYCEYVFKNEKIKRVLLSLGRGLMAIDRGNGKFNTIRLKVPREELRSLKLPISNFKEVNKIANFLDLKTSEFDSVIEKKEKLIEKLEEAKKSLISEVVTGKKRVFEDEKGELKLENRKPSEMKDSDVEWLGMIPEEWELTKLKYLIQLTMGQSPDSTSINDNKIGLPFFQGKTEFGKINPVPRVYCNEPKKIGKIDEILISVRAPVGDLNIVDKECCIGRGLASMKPLDNQLYLYNLLDTAKDLLKSYATGSTFEAISTEQLKNIKIIKPSIGEQNIISLYLLNKRNKFDSIIETNKKQIEKIKEAKQSLISETVTGKIEVLL